MSNKRILQLVDQQQCLALPGIYDTLSAKLAQRTGFPLGFVSGYSVAATSIGQPDLGLLTQTEIVQVARAICSSVTIPILVDADTGYGNPLNVQRTVSELIDAGAAGCFLEDQVWPKRCGHMRGKRVIDRDDYLQKIHAAVDARGDHDFVIVARTDALAVHGMDEAILRVESAREMGADLSFVEAPTSEQQLAEIGQRSPGPNVANMIEGGRTPLLSKDQLAAMGFHLILYPLAGLYAAAQATWRLYEHLHGQGTTLGSGVGQLTFEQFNDIIGVEDKYRLAEKYQIK